MPSLWPREHGASLQLAFPVFSACALAGAAPAALLLGLAAVLAFIAHEPLLLLSGGRGARKREQARVPARRRLLLLGVLALLAAAAAMWLAEGDAGWWLLLPGVLGAGAFGIALAGRERNVFAEVFVAVTLSSLALPIARVGGVSLASAASLSGVWALGFGVATLAARALVVQKRDAGRGLRLALVGASLVGFALVGAAAAQLVSAHLAAAPLPLVLLAMILGAFPPPPQRMTAVGFGMAAASVVTCALALTAL